MIRGMEENRAKEVRGRCQEQGGLEILHPVVTGTTF